MKNKHTYAAFLVIIFILIAPSFPVLSIIIVSIGLAILYMPRAKLNNETLITKTNYDLCNSSNFNNIKIDPDNRKLGYDDLSKLNKEQTEQHIKQWMNFGVKTANCPYCKKDLPKFPKRRSKCRECEKFIFVKKNPYSNEYFLYRENEKNILSELLSIYSNSWKNWFYDVSDISRIRKELANKYKTSNANSIPFNDIVWSSLINIREHSATGNDWGTYLFATIEMIKILLGEEKYKSGENLAFEYIYLRCLYNIQGGMGMVIPASELWLILKIINIEAVNEYFDNQQNTKLVKTITQNIENKYLKSIDKSGWVNKFGISSQETFNCFISSTQSFLSQKL